MHHHETALMSDVGRLSRRMLVYKIFLYLVLVSERVRAADSFTIIHRKITWRKVFASSPDEMSDTTSDADSVEWGVSYIGGDPCGSKYNDDPFDASKEIAKPGMPDSMKARIADLAEKKLQQQREKEEEVD